MINLFYELCQNHFEIPFLEDQLKDFETEKEAIMYINYCMNEFEKKQIHHWMRTIELHNETGKLYGYDDLSLELGTFGFYIADPDEKVSFYETTYGMKLEMSLNDFIRQCERLLKYYKPSQAETKSEKLIVELGKYGFFELPLIKQLTEPSKQSIIELISKNGLPYSIAMFEYLGFLEHIRNEHFKTGVELNKTVAKWFSSDRDGRTVKGNISSLSGYSGENKGRYTAHNHKENVKKDYQNLK